MKRFALLIGVLFLPLLSCSKRVAFKQVETYEDMLKLKTPKVLTVVKVANDADKYYTNSEYNLWPDGTILMTVHQTPTDYDHKTSNPKQ